MNRGAWRATVHKVTESWTEHTAHTQAHATGITHSHQAEYKAEPERHTLSEPRTLFLLHDQAEVTGYKPFKN